MEERKLQIAVVCSSNQNRSMEAQYWLSKKGFDVRSFGTGAQVKLPGASASEPNVYSFETTYEEIYNDLVRKDKNMYTQNGLLSMLDRNRRMKLKPDRFQACADRFDLVLTVEEHVYELVLEDLHARQCDALRRHALMASRAESENVRSRRSVSGNGSETIWNTKRNEVRVTHVVNMDVQDNHDDATLGAFLICDLVRLLANAASQLDAEVDSILGSFELERKRPLLHTVFVY